MSNGQHDGESPVYAAALRAYVKQRDRGCVAAHILKVYDQCQGGLQIDHVRASGGLGMKSLPNAGTSSSSAPGITSPRPSTAGSGARCCWPTSSGWGRGERHEG